MKSVIVFGATGGTGLQVVKQALEAGFSVTAVVRNPDTFPLRHASLELVKADVFQPAGFEKAIAGKDAVISCLGSRGRGPTTLYSEGTGNIIRLMHQTSAKRLICLSAGAVVVPPQCSVIMKFVIKNVLQKLLRYAYADMLLMEDMLRHSGLDWTVIRPPRLLNTAGTGKYRVAVNKALPYPSKIARADLAAYILEHLEDEQTFEAKVEVSY